MKYLGIDYGSHFTGLAISDQRGIIAFPRADIATDDKLLPFILQMIEDEEIDLIVAGDTRSYSGTPNPITEEAEEFLQDLAEGSGVPIEKVSEIWSSIEAARYAPDTDMHNNAAAAAFILQRYIDMRGENKDNE